jgi:tRNA A-37 threonylcarbamoyl transferase component Bud32
MSLVASLPARAASLSPQDEPRIWINPEYREFLAEQGLQRSADFLNLPGTILCGHPDRHVLKVSLSEGADALGAFLKREHRVRWRDRLGNALAGFGPVSKSLGEAQVLRSLAEVGIGCPEVLAAGEDSRGKAFLLLKELAGTQELRQFLADLTNQSLDRPLGEALAQIHDAGFDHPDLVSKHVLVEPQGPRFHFLDWQRAQRRLHLSWARRWHNLAVLHASLAERLASPRQRLRCLHAYLQATLAGPVPRTFRKKAARRIHRLAEKYRTRRRFAELRQTPLASGQQALIWLAGEGLCVTPQFLERCRGQVPKWLTRFALEGNTQDGLRSCVERKLLDSEANRQVLFQRRQGHRFCWSLRPTSPELAQAGLLFRLQRHGIPTPRLLAVGQQFCRGGAYRSFLLVESEAQSEPLQAWLARPIHQPLWSAERKQRRQVLRQAGAVLRQMHEAQCYFRSGSDQAATLNVIGGGPLAVGLASVDAVVARRRPDCRLAKENVNALLKQLATARCSRTDRCRFIRGYESQ